MVIDESDARADALHDEARAWMRRLYAGRPGKPENPSNREVSQLRQWCARSPAHRAALARARVEWGAMASLGDVYDRLYPGHRDEAVRSREAMADPRRRWILGAGFSAAGVAAVVATAGPALGLMPSLSDLAADHRTGTGEQVRLAVSEQIELMLNTQTSVDVRAGAGAQGVDQIRLVSGEASIQRGRQARPVDVIAGPGRIVPGVGNVGVRRVGDRYCVTCSEGEAQLLHPQRSLMLRAAERVWYGTASVEAVQTIDLDLAMSWQQGMVAFDATPLSEAVAEINRYRPGRVVLMNDALSRKRLSGHFAIGDLDEAIQQIERVFGAEATHLPAGVTVLS